MLFDEDACGKRLFRVVVADRYDPLRDDGSAVQRFIDEVNCAATTFNAVFNRLALGIQTGEGWQKTRVDIEDASAESRDE